MFNTIQYRIILIILVVILGFNINAKKRFSNQLPIVYSDDYNISFFGLENFHRFDAQKFGKIFSYLRSQLHLTQEQFFEPSEVDSLNLLTTHSKKYLDSLKSSSVLARILEMPILRFVPNFLLQDIILRPMKLSTGGTLLGMKLALKHGWAINLSGGYHHAKREAGSGFCIYADIPIAVQSFLSEKKEGSVLIVDLDAHQGNGVSWTLRNTKRVFIFDVYNEEIWPNDVQAESFIDYHFPVKRTIEDKTYLNLVQNQLSNSIKDSKPSLIIYNAGNDILKNDPSGKMNISTNAVITRDEIVFKTALEQKIPILMVLSGGYAKRSGEVAASSIVNLVNKFQLK